MSLPCCAWVQVGGLRARPVLPAVETVQREQHRPGAQPCSLRGAASSWRSPSQPPLASAPPVDPTARELEPSHPEASEAPNNSVFMPPSWVSDQPKVTQHGLQSHLLWRPLLSHFRGKGGTQDWFVLPRVPLAPPTRFGDPQWPFSQPGPWWALPAPPLQPFSCPGTPTAGPVGRCRAAPPSPPHSTHRGQDAAHHCCCHCRQRPGQEPPHAWKSATPASTEQPRGSGHLSGELGPDWPCPSGAADTLPLPPSGGFIKARSDVRARDKPCIFL